MKSEFDCTGVGTPTAEGLQRYTKVQEFLPLEALRPSIRAIGKSRETVQHPFGGPTRRVAAVPVVLAGAIIAGLARSIEILSLHAAEFGVGITVVAGSMLVLPRLAIAD